MSGEFPDVDLNANRGTRYFFILGILFACGYLFVRLALPSGTHWYESENESLRHAIILMFLGWQAMKGRTGWAWVGTFYLAMEAIYSAWGMFGSASNGMEAHILFIKLLMVFLGYRSARRVSRE